MPEQFIIPAGEILAPLDAETRAGPQGRDYRKGRVGTQARFLIGTNDEIDVRVILAHNGQIGIGLALIAEETPLDGPLLFAALMRSGRQQHPLEIEGNGWRGSVPRALLSTLEIILQRAEGSEIVGYVDESEDTVGHGAPPIAHAPPGDA